MGLETTFGSRMRDRKSARIGGIGALLLAAPLVLAACGSSGGSQAGGGGTSPAAKSTSVTIDVHSGPMGSYLTDQSGKTLYMFVGDTATHSHCNSACLTYWPQVGSAKAGSGVSGKIETITTNGKPQATFDGHPLYYFALDKSPGETKGQGSSNFGAKWWILAPSGKPITSTSSSGGSHSSSSSGGGGGGGGWG